METEGKDRYGTRRCMNTPCRRLDPPQSMCVHSERRINCWSSPHWWITDRDVWSVFVNGRPDKCRAWSESLGAIRQQRPGTGAPKMVGGWREIPHVFRSEDWSNFACLGCVMYAVQRAAFFTFGEQNSISAGSPPSQTSMEALISLPRTLWLWMGGQIARKRT